MLIKLKVFEKVFIHNNPAGGMTNNFKIEVNLGSKTVSTVEKTYQEFKIFQNTLINFIRANQEDVFDVPTLEQGIRYREQIQASSGDYYR